MPSDFHCVHDLDVIHLFFTSADERSQIAYVTFKDLQGAETAVLLSVSYKIVFVFMLINFPVMDGLTIVVLVLFLLLYLSTCALTSCILGSYHC